MIFEHENQSLFSSSSSMEAGARSVTREILRSQVERSMVSSAVAVTFRTCVFLRDKRKLSLGMKLSQRKVLSALKYMCTRVGEVVPKMELKWGFSNRHLKKREKLGSNDARWLLSWPFEQSPKFSSTIREGFTTFCPKMKRTWPIGWSGKRESSSSTSETDSRHAFNLLTGKSV